jgi:DNA polymerase-1
MRFSRRCSIARWKPYSAGHFISAIARTSGTLYNFPMQSNGAEMLRLAAWRLCEANIVPNMLIHDGILLEVRNKEQITHAIEIMKAAGRDVCDGFEIGVDVDQMLEGGARYRDKRPVARKMWDTMMRALQGVGAMPKGVAA